MDPRGEGWKTSSPKNACVGGYNKTGGCSKAGRGSIPVFTVLRKSVRFSIINMWPKMQMRALPACSLSVREGKIDLSRADWSRAVNYAKWSWRNFSSGERDFSYGEFSTEMDVKNWQCYCKKQIEHNIFISHDPYSYWRPNVQNFEVKPWAAGKWLHLSFDVTCTIDKSTDHGKLLMFNGTRVGMLT